MYCIKCGAEIAAESKFCIVCGAPQRAGTDSGQARPERDQAANADAKADDATTAAQHLDRAFEYEERRQLRNALRECDEAVQLAPQVSEAHNLRGIILEQLDRESEAVSAYQQAVRLAPDFHEARENLNQLLTKRASGRNRLDQSTAYRSRSLERASAAKTTTMGAVVGIAGGGLIVLGWLIPWFSIGGLLGALGSTLGIGGGGGLLGGSSGMGLGSGIQLTLGAVTAGFAAFATESWLGSGAVFLGMIALALAGILITIPILGGVIVRQGVRFLEVKKYKGDMASLTLRSGCETYKKRARVVFVIMLAFFILLAALPMAVSTLGLGFYMTMLGAIGTYVGAVLLRSRAEN